MHHTLTENTKFHQVISLTNSTQTLFTEIKFNALNQIIEDFDFEGITIFSNTLSWAPYFLIENCDEFGRNCDLSGFLADYMDALGKVLNFAWTSHAHPDRIWGVRPIYIWAWAFVVKKRPKNRNWKQRIDRPKTDR